MATVSITTPAGKTDGTVDLPAEIFDVQSNIPLMHQVVVAQLAAARQGTHATKTRADVRGGGKKPYRQKGTGRARQGSTRAPQFTGGGVVHGPQPHGYAQRTPKKMKAAALRGALSDRARSGNVHVLSSLVDSDTPSTKMAIAALKAVADSKNILVVVAREDEAGWKSLRNAGAVHLISSDQLNTYDVLCADDVVFTKGALDEFLSFAKPGTSVNTPESEVADEVKPAVSTTKAAPKKADTAKAGSTAAAKADKADAAKADKAGKADTVKADKADKAGKADTAKADKTEAAAPQGLLDASAADAKDAPEAKGGKDFGPDSHLPLAGDKQPAGYPIKGNADSMLYHVPGSRFYDATIAEVWFRTEEAAEAAGFQLPPSQRDNAEGDDK